MLVSQKETVYHKETKTSTFEPYILGKSKQNSFANRSTPLPSLLFPIFKPSLVTRDPHVQSSPQLVKFTARCPHPPLVFTHSSNQGAFQIKPVLFFNTLSQLYQTKAATMDHVPILEQENSVIKSTSATNVNGLQCSAQVKLIGLKTQFAETAGVKRNEKLKNYFIN